MTRAERIETALAEGINLEHIEVVDESSNHSVPDGAESHFKVVAVSQEFESKSRIVRHRTINGLLQPEFDAGMHALAVHAYTLQEWRDRYGEAPLSPPCAGGNKAES